MAVWTVAALLFSWTAVTCRANVTYTGTPEEECGRSKFCKSDCECRSVDRGAKGVIKECVKRNILDRSTAAKYCGQSGLPVVKIAIRTRGRRRITVASAVKTKAKKCPMDKIVPYKKYCCSLVDKPGQCPFFLGSVQQCGEPCQADNNCQGHQKCCHTNCDQVRKRCVDPLPKVNCARKFCGPYASCKNTLNGARCCEEKPGECPSQQTVLCGSGTTHYSCLSCVSDEDCRGNRKCCPCNDCIQCMRPGTFPRVCDRVRCSQPEEVCVENKGTCSTPSCPAVATCRPQGSNPGRCPTVSDQDEKACRSAECQQDSDCGPARHVKCCPSACGARKRCVRALLLSSCDGVICPEGKTCHEVLKKESRDRNSDGEAVTPICLEQKPLFSDACGGKQPLLLWVSDRDLEVVNCGADLSKLTCPSGYACTPRAGTFPLCCPQDKPPCNPPCLDSQKCETEFIPGCRDKPCVFTTCVTKNVCMLPMMPDDGYCTNKAEQVRMYYFDNKEHKCKAFGYNCGGNANRFHTLQDCRDKCETTKALDICLLPKHPGLCWSGFSRKVVYYFDQNYMQCRSMPDASCGLKDRNANNFPLMDDCASHCEGKFHCPPARPGERCRNTADKCRMKDEGELLPVCPPGKACCDTSCGRRCVLPIPY